MSAALVPRGDDHSDDTVAIQSAIERTAGQSATVIIPPGRDHSSTLFIRSDTTVGLDQELR